jgi:hypothetical protein
MTSIQKIIVGAACVGVLVLLWNFFEHSTAANKAIEARAAQKALEQKVAAEQAMKQAASKNENDASIEAAAANAAKDAATRAADKKLSLQKECIQKLTADIAEKKLSYEKGTLLASFKDGTTFDQAEARVRSYQLRIQNRSQAQQSFDSNRIVSVVVPEGSELEKICILRSDTLVRTATINILFDLHE